MVKKGERNDARLDNFEATEAEEQRAWDLGYPYLEKYIDEYYSDNPDCAPKVHQAVQRIKRLFMQATALSKDMYLEPDALDNLTDDEAENILTEKREKFFSERGSEFKAIYEEIKNEKIGAKPDWDAFTAVVKEAVEDILIDNEK